MRRAVVAAADRFDAWLDGPSFTPAQALLIAFPASVLLWALLVVALLALGAGQ